MKSICSFRLLIALTLLLGVARASRGLEAPNAATGIESPLLSIDPPIYSQAEWTENSWQIQTVDSQKDVASYTSLALDSLNQPHISYSGRGGLKYARWTGEAWQIQTVDSQGDVGECSSLALNSLDQPHLSYSTCILSFCALKHARWTGEAWQIQTVDGPGDVGLYNSLALDSLDRPHISYFDGTNDDLKYARWTGDAWIIQIVDGPGHVGWYNSLALDSLDQPHISYFDGYPHYHPKYARWTGDAWQVQTIDREGDAGWHTSLALDSLDQPHTSYFDSTNGDLKYAHQTGGTWQVQTVDREGDVGGYTSLAMDNLDRPHVSYYDFDNGDLKYAWAPPPSPFLDKQVMPSHNVGNGDRLTYTLTLSGPGLNVRLWDPLPATVQYLSGSLTGTVTPGAVYSPTTRAIVWQGRLPTETAWVIRFQVTPEVTGTGSLTLLFPIVNTAWLTDLDSGQIVSATATANGFRLYLPLVLKN